MYLLFDEIANRYGTQASSLRFLLDDDRIDGNETICTLELDDGDTIDCVKEQTGC